MFATVIRTSRAVWGVRPLIAECARSAVARKGFMRPNARDAMWRIKNGKLRKVNALARRREHRQQFAVHEFIAAGDRAAGHEVGPAVRIGNETARLAHDQRAGGDVPGVEAALPE